MKGIITLILLLTGITGHSQASPEELISNFFEVYAYNSDKAIDNLYATNKYTAEISDAISSLKKTVRNYPVELGKFYGYELVTSKKLTDRFKLFSYFMRYDRQPVKITFEFYNPNDRWILYSLNFVSDFDEDLENAAKFDLQNPDKK